MKQILTILLTTLALADISGQQLLEPFRVSLTVKNIDVAARWYEENLGFETYKKLDFPEYDSLKIYFLKTDNFELELLEKKTSFSIQKFVPNYSVNKEPLIGYYKISFRVEDISRLYQRLKQNKVTLIIDLTYDEVFESEFFIISDIDGNIIQLIEPKN